MDDKILVPEILKAYTKRHNNLALAEAFECLKSFEGREFTLENVLQITVVLENCEEVILKPSDIVYLSLGELQPIDNSSDFYGKNFYLIFQASDAAKLQRRLQKKQDLVYFEVLYTDQSKQRFFIIWDPCSNESQANYAQNSVRCDQYIFVYAKMSATILFKDILPAIKAEKLYFITQSLLEELPENKLAEFEKENEERKIKKYWFLLEGLDGILSQLQQFANQAEHTKGKYITVKDHQITIIDDDNNTTPSELYYLPYNELVQYQLMLTGNFWEQLADVIREITFLGITLDQRAQNIERFTNLLNGEIARLRDYKNYSLMEKFLLQLREKEDIEKYWSLAKGYKKVRSATEDIEVTFVGQDLDLLAEFITQYDTRYCNFLKENNLLN